MARLAHRMNPRNWIVFRKEVCPEGDQNCAKKKTKISKLNPKNWKKSKKVKCEGGEKECKTKFSKLAKLNPLNWMKKRQSNSTEASGEPQPSRLTRLRQRLNPKNWDLFANCDEGDLECESEVSSPKDWEVAQCFRKKREGETGCVKAVINVTKTLIKDITNEALS